ncbi:SpoIIE family protein phosphatase [Streptomyces lydicus]|uniref:SpoIIE family protein phosphatase n=1 Tax=Streptomyces lydicus TaxID=47763 RepID=UPI00368DCCE7
MAADRGIPSDGLTGRKASFDVADATVFLLDARGRVESWPTAAGRLLGHSASTAVGRPAAELLAPDDAARVPVLAAECRERGGWSGLLSALRDDGGVTGILVQVARVTDGEGRLHWLVLATEAPPAHGWEMGREVLERIVTASPVGMAIVDTDLRCVWANPALEQYGGGPAAQRIGRRLGELQPRLDTAALEAQMRRVLQTGEPVTGYEHTGRVASDPYHDRAQTMSFVRLDDPEGRPMGLCYTVVDVTEHYRSRRQMALLDRAGEYIGRTLDVMQTAQDLADVAVPELADFVTVDLLDSVVRGEEPQPGPLSDADTVLLRRAGQQSLRPGVPEAVIEIGGLASYHAWTPPIRALAGGGSWRAGRLDPGSAAWGEAPDGRHVQFEELGLHTVMVVPIRARGTTMGVASFFRSQGDQAFTDDDLRLAEEFVARAAVCMDNARRYTRERESALALQRSLLPQAVPAQDAVCVASAYRPANELGDVGGDWFDVLALSGARVALVVGDVTGHGLDAVATMGRLRTAVQTLAALDLRPEELLGHLDDVVGRVVREEKSRRARSGALGSSCLYAVYDPIDRRCTMASAGHPAPAVIAPDRTVTFVDLPVGPRLGVGGLPFESLEFEVPEGSVLALYTDGLLSGAPTGRGEPPGKERLRQTLAAPAPTLDALCSHVIDELVSVRPQDDVALLLARTRVLDPERRALWDLPADPAIVAEARAAATGQLERWGMHELVFTTELVVSELVTNALRHATEPIQLRLILGRTLICEVADGSSTSPYLRHPRTTDESGRGLFIISQFADRWGTRYTTTGKVIWTEQALPGQDAS